MVEEVTYNQGEEQILPLVLNIFIMDVLKCNINEVRISGRGKSAFQLSRQSLTLIHTSRICTEMN
jgi:hypothetical protein